MAVVIGPVRNFCSAIAQRLNPCASPEDILSDSLKYLKAYLENPENISLQNDLLIILEDLLAYSQHPAGNPQCYQFAQLHPGVLERWLARANGHIDSGFAPYAQNHILPILEPFVRGKTGRLSRLSGRIVNWGLQKALEAGQREAPFLTARHAPPNVRSALASFMPHLERRRRRTGPLRAPSGPETPLHSFMRRALEFLRLVEKDAAPGALSATKKMLVKWCCSLGHSYLNNPALMAQIAPLIETTLLDPEHATSELRALLEIFNRPEFANSDSFTWFGPLYRTEEELRAIADRPVGDMVLSLDQLHREIEGDELPPERKTARQLRHETDTILIELTRLSAFNALERMVASFCGEDSEELKKLDDRIRRELLHNPFATREGLETAYGWNHLVSKSFNRRYKRVADLPPKKRLKEFIVLLKGVVNQSSLSWVKKAGMKLMLDAAGSKLEGLIHEMGAEWLTTLRKMLDQMRSAPLDKMHSRPIDEITGVLLSILNIYHDRVARNVQMGFEQFFKEASESPEYNRGVSVEMTHAYFTEGVVRKYCPHLNWRQRVLHLSARLHRWCLKRASVYLKLTKLFLTAPIRIGILIVANCIVAPIQFMTQRLIKLIMRIGLNYYKLSKLMLDKLCAGLYTSHGQTQYSFASRQIIHDLLELIAGAISRSLDPKKIKTEDPAFDSVKEPLGELLSTLFRLLSISRFRSREHMHHILEDRSNLARLFIEIEKLAMPEVVTAIVDVLSSLIQDLTDPHILEPLLQKGLRSLTQSMLAEGLPLSDSDMERMQSLENGIRTHGNNVVALIIDRALMIEMQKLFEGKKREHIALLEKLQQKVVLTARRWETTLESTTIDTTLLRDVRAMRRDVATLVHDTMQGLKAINQLLSRNPDPRNQYKLGALTEITKALADRVADLHNRLQLHVEAHRLRKPLFDIQQRTQEAYRILCAKHNQTLRYTSPCDPTITVDFNDISISISELDQMESPLADCITSLKQHTSHILLYRIKKYKEAIEALDQAQKFKLLMQVPLDEIGMDVTHLSKRKASDKALIPALIREKEQQMQRTLRHGRVIVSLEDRSTPFYDDAIHLAETLLDDQTRQVFISSHQEGGILRRLSNCQTIEELASIQQTLIDQTELVVHESIQRAQQARLAVEEALAGGEKHQGIRPLSQRATYLLQEAERTEPSKFTTALSKVGDTFLKMQELSQRIQLPEINYRWYQQFRENPLFREIRAISFNTAFDFLLRLSDLLSQEATMRLFAHRGLQVAAQELGTLKHR